MMSAVNGMCAARRRDQCAYTFEFGEIVAVKFDVSRPVWIDPSPSAEADHNVKNPRSITRGAR